MQKAIAAIVGRRFGFGFPSNSACVVRLHGYPILSNEYLRRAREPDSVQQLLAKL
jgi:hypothetical protein